MSKILILSYLVLVTGCNYMKELPPDSIGEEILEQIIEQSISLDLDLSPSSPE